MVCLVASAGDDDATFVRFQRDDFTVHGCRQLQRLRGRRRRSDDQLCAVRLPPLHARRRHALRVRTRRQRPLVHRALLRRRPLVQDGRHHLPTAGARRRRLARARNQSAAVGAGTGQRLHGPPRRLPPLLHGRDAVPVAALSHVADGDHHAHRARLVPPLHGRLHAVPLRHAELAVALSTPRRLRRRSRDPLQRAALLRVPARRRLLSDGGRPAQLHHVDPPGSTIQLTYLLTSSRPSTSSPTSARTASSAFFRAENHEIGMAQNAQLFASGGVKIGVLDRG